MSTRLAPLLGTLLMTVMANQSALAQDPPKTPTLPSFQVLHSFGTPDETPFIQSSIARARAKFTGDQTFVKAVDDALAKRDYRTARNLVAAAVQVRPDEVAIGQRGKGATSRQAGSMVHFASARRPAPFASERLNPFVVIVAFKDVALCWGTSAACVAELKKMGYLVVVPT